MIQANSPGNGKPDAEQSPSLVQAATISCEPSVDPDRFARAFAELATEIWRLGMRLNQVPNANPRVIDSHTRLLRTLEDNGCRIDDPINRPFIEGINAEIIDIPPDVDLSTEPLIISDVLRPAIYVDNTCVVRPQIILDRAPSKGNV